MDLTSLTIEELRQKLDDLDKTKSPHEGLELSNEIGRRTVKEDEIKKINTNGLKTIQRSPLIAFAGITTFLSISIINPPDIMNIIFTLFVSILLTLSYFRIWKKRAIGLNLVCIGLMAILSNRFLGNLFEQLQYLSLLVGVSMAIVYLFRDKALRTIEGEQL
jgi:hypothetical protein